MKRISLIVVLAATLVSAMCSASNRDPNCPDYSRTKPGFYGGNGSSEKQAVETVGVDYTQERWLDEKYPGSKVTLRELVISPKTEKKYDVISIETAEGKSITVWFWVSGGIMCFLKD